MLGQDMLGLLLGHADPKYRSKGDRLRGPHSGSDNRGASVVASCRHQLNQSHTKNSKPGVHIALTDKDSIDGESARSELSPSMLSVVERARRNTQRATLAFSFCA